MRPFAVDTLWNSSVDSLNLGMRWEDVDFERNLIHLRRSIVKQRIGPPKTEASQKPIPLNAELAKSLRLWKMKTIYNRPDDWVYANPPMKGTQPFVKMLLPGIRKTAR